MKHRQVQSLDSRAKGVIQRRDANKAPRKGIGLSVIAGSNP